MSLRLYNTLDRTLEDFTPLQGSSVGLYTCGPTVYNTAHIGNLRTYIFEDVLRRTLEFNGYKVKHVMNITDVGHLTDDGDMGEDKIAKASRETKRDAYAIAKEYESQFFVDLQQLNILPPTVKLRATETIDLQVALIQKLETKGFTYRTSDGIYFDTAKLPSYGQLSGQKSADKKAGARVEVNDEKKHPTDFALWKFSKPEDKRQMEWPSPWGIGFPGWHIECSAMSLSEFPNGLDIHCGGIDHIAVHHENEIAQNEASGHKDFVKVWMHGEFLKLPGKRMGKSEGNAITLQDVIVRGIDPLAFRYLSLQTHYRKPLSFTWESLEAAQAGLTSIWEKIASLTEGTAEPIGEYLHELQRYVDEDLNTAKAVALVQKLLGDPRTDSQKIVTLQKMDTVLGLQLNPEYAKQHVQGHTAISINDLPSDVQFLVTTRNAARSKKDFTESDRIKKDLEALGYSVTDTSTGTQLRKS